MSEWEPVNDSDKSAESTSRMKVPGGWIYLHQTDGTSESMVFVPEQPE